MIAEFMAANAGPLLTIGGPVAVAMIGGYWMLKARRSRGGGEPTAIKDVWEENRLTRQEADRARDENRAQSDALSVLWSYIGRLIDAWGRPAMPVLTRKERVIIERVIEDVTTPGGGITAPAPTE